MFGFPPPAQADELGNMIDALSTPENTLPGVRVRRSFNRPAKPRTHAVEAMARAARAVSEALGRELPFGSTGGVCDVRRLRRRQRRHSLSSPMAASSGT
jgi:acetylornithine deacetylase/succinyl-diaminopimelate desuccinylase-like protein